MRRIVFEAIVARYKRRLNKLDELGCFTNSDLETRTLLRKREELRAGQITIEEYLAPLTDNQLLDVFESQCCQDFR